LKWSINGGLPVKQDGVCPRIAPKSGRQQRKFERRPGEPFHEFCF